MNAYLYVFDTLADWEVGYITAELNTGRYFRERGSRMPVIPVGSSTAAVTSMGGLRIVPACPVSEVRFDAGDLLLLPGGDTWTEPLHDAVLDLVPGLLENGVIVAAICGATVALAGRGGLDTRRHTSNDRDYLKSLCPGYAGGHLYAMEPAVTDRGLITASGVAPLKFAREILQRLDVFRPETLEAWYHLYRTGEAKYFYSLMRSIETGE
ncbi:MAG: glutamine amidotransferase [Spirochaetes bacterium]|nr:glutamine amidotransferase [Spirochaetota bacterium]